MSRQRTNHFMSSESEVPSAKSCVLIFMSPRRHAHYTQTLPTGLALGQTLKLRASRRCIADQSAAMTPCDWGTSFSWSVIREPRSTTAWKKPFRPAPYNTEVWRIGWLSRYSASLRARRSWDRIHVQARFSPPVQSGPESHSASYTMSTGSLCPG
jgi:hypothetical protein